MEANSDTSAAPAPRYKYEAKREVALPGGGSITVTVSSPEPIDEGEYLILRPGAATAMAECLVNLANAFRSPDSPEIVLPSQPAA